MTTTSPPQAIAPDGTGRTSHEATAAEFVQRFATTWDAPDPAALNRLVHPEIEFIQPLETTIHGRDEAAAFWRRLFTLMPDVRGEVLSWGSREDLVYIEFRMFGTLGGKPFAWVVLDRIRLEEGLVRQRVAYFNPLPLVLAVVTRPRAWPAYLAAQRQRLMS